MPDYEGYVGQVVTNKEGTWVFSAAHKWELKKGPEDEPEVGGDGAPDYEGYVGQIVTNEAGTWAFSAAHKWELQGPEGPEGPEDPNRPEGVSDEDWADYHAYVRITEEHYPGTAKGFDEWLEWRTGLDPEGPGDVSSEALWEIYRDMGGNLLFEDWMAAGQPAPGLDVVTEDDYKDFRAWATSRGYDIDTMGPGAAELYEAWHDMGSPRPEEEVEEEVEGEVDDFASQLAESIEAYKQQIQEMAEAERAEAQRLGARDIGKMSRMTQQALLAQGRTAGEIEQLTAGGMEAGARSLNDLLQALSLGEKRQLAGAEQFGIGTMISGEELALRERQMAQQMGQYQQSFAEQRRQFGVGAGQWQQGFGLSQQQLAQQARYQQGQLGLGQQQARGDIWGPLMGALGQIGGAALGSVFGPAGSAIGAGIGQWVGPGGGGWFGGRYGGGS